jgi:hypothetical protein
MASGIKMDLHWTRAAKDKLVEIDLLMGDVLHVLKYGFVYSPGVPSTRVGLFKYQMEAPTPNSNNRTVRVVVIPSEKDHGLKIIDVQWVDDPIVKS